MPCCLKNLKRAEEIWADYVHSLRDSGTFATLFPTHSADANDVFVKGAQTPTFQTLIGYLVFVRDTIKGQTGAPAVRSVSTLWASLHSLWRAKTASDLEPAVTRQVTRWLHEEMENVNRDHRQRKMVSVEQMKRMSLHSSTSASCLPTRSSDWQWQSGRL